MKTLNKKSLSKWAGAVGVLALCGTLHGQTVALQQATATHSQPNYAVSGVIDGDDFTGWGVARLDGTTLAETVVFETAQDIDLGVGALLTFRLKSGGFPGANLGRYRLSITSDARHQFADGLADGGDVTANWVVLNPYSFKSVGGAIVTKLSDNSLLVSGRNPDFDTNVVQAVSSLAKITGIRLEVMEDASLPTGGPGRHANGNVTLYDLTLMARPTTADLLSTITVASVDICWPGVPGRTYQVQYLSELTTNLWVNLGGPAPGNGTNCVTDVVRGKEKRFYQVRYAP